MVEFGAKPLPFLINKGAKEMFDWMEQEFESLPLVIAGASDYATSFCCEGMLKLLESEGCSEFLKFEACSY